PFILLPHDVILPVPAVPATNAAPMNPASPGDVLTQRYNNLRTGTTLQPGFDQDAVGNRFGFIGILGAQEPEDTQDLNAIDGVVLAQPLFMERVIVKGQLRSAVFIATSANWVYAFDADTRLKLWGKRLGNPYTVFDPFQPSGPKREACNMASTQNHDF